MNHLCSVFLFRGLAIGMVVLLGACATEQEVTKTQVKKDAWGRDVGFSLGKDKDGNPVMKSDRRSSFEGKRSQIAGGRDFSGRDYTTKSYRKKRWSGSNRIFGKKEYQGNTDARGYQKEPWFVRKQANSQNKRARADGRAYSVNRFRTGSAREQNGRRIARVSDAETDVRRRVFKEPEIIHWKEQKGMSVKDTNRLLGR